VLLKQIVLVLATTPKVALQPVLPDSDLPVAFNNFPSPVQFITLHATIVFGLYVDVLNHNYLCLWLLLVPFRFAKYNDDGPIPPG